MELPSYDLADQGFGQALAELHSPGYFVRCQCLFAIPDQFLLCFLRWLDSRLQYHKCRYCFSAVDIWHCRHPRFCDSRMVEQDLFHFSRVHLKATGVDHLLRTLNYIEVAVCIHFPQVPGTHPPMAEYGFRFLVVLPVALHDVGSLEHYLTYLPNRYRLPGRLIHDSGLNIRKGKANTARAALLGKRIGVGHRSSLAQAVSLDQFATGGCLEVRLHLRG